MTTPFSIDHIVIMVDNLAVAVEDYTALGFTVLEGGVHEANPTHNALVVFEDGVYLEIIALRPGEEDSPQSDRLQKWVRAKPGLVDLALLPRDIEADISAARARGVDIEDASPGGRLSPDGRQIAWQTANLRGDGLPFFCADVTPRAWRVPEGNIRQHANGVTGVTNVTITVTDLAVSSRQWQALLDIEPRFDPHLSTLEAKTATFSLNESTTVTLAQPLNESSPLQAYLVSGGARPFSFTLKTTKPIHRPNLNLTKTHWARIKLVE